MAVASFTLQTERLLLNSLRMDDWPVVLAEWGVPAVAQMTATFRTDWTEQTVKEWIAHRLRPGQSGFGCAVRRVSDNKLIGSVGMGGEPRNMGYAFGQAYWGQGYASEAVRAFLTAAYSHEMGLDVVEATVFDDNPASARVLTKIGFERAGASDCSSLARVEPAPSSLYRLTRSQFECLA